MYARLTCFYFKRNTHQAAPRNAVFHLKHPDYIKQTKRSIIVSTSRRRFSLVAALVLALGAQGPAAAGSGSIVPGVTGTVASARIDSLFTQ